MRGLRGVENAGTKLKLEGSVDDGLTHYEEAIEICETYGPAYYNIGVVHSEAKQVGTYLADCVLKAW